MNKFTKKERILLKLSGASMRGKNDENVISDEVVRNLADQIKKIALEREVAIVIGGGNIWRGRSHTTEPLNNKDTHFIGMLATVMNAIVLQNYLSHKGIGSTIFSAIPIPAIAEEMSSQNLKRAFHRGDVVIFAGGTGVPFVTTDTCAAIRAMEIEADKILIGKNGVRGVYDKDPNRYDDAVFYDRVSYEEIIDKGLEVMDLTAMSLLLSHNRPQLIVFNNDEENSFIKALEGKISYTLVF